MAVCRILWCTLVYRKERSVISQESLSGPEGKGYKVSCSVGGWFLYVTFINRFASAGTTYGARYAHAPHSPRRPATARAWFLSYMADGTLYAGRVGHSEAGGRSAE